MVRRGRVLVLCPNLVAVPDQCQMPTPDLGIDCRHATMGNTSNDISPRGWLEITQNNENRRVGTFRNQPETRNEVTRKECRQYSAQMPQPIVRILASRRTWQCIWLPCGLHHGPPKPFVASIQILLDREPFCRIRQPKACKTAVTYALLQALVRMKWNI